MTDEAIQWRRQVRAQRLQVAGLAVLLVAMAWQNFFSDWFDRTATEWQYFIQAEVHSAAARQTASLAKAMAASAPGATSQQLTDTANAALLELTQIALERDERRARDERRSLALKYARFAQFVLGAALLIVGVAMAASPRKPR
jgi:type II secretory pathway component PulM